MLCNIPYTDIMLHNITHTDLMLHNIPHTDLMLHNIPHTDLMLRSWQAVATNFWVGSMIMSYMVDLLTRCWPKLNSKPGFCNKYAAWLTVRSWRAACWILGHLLLRHTGSPLSPVHVNHQIHQGAKHHTDLYNCTPWQMALALFFSSFFFLLLLCISNSL